MQQLNSCSGLFLGNCKNYHQLLKYQTNRMGSANSRLEDTKAILNIFKVTIQEIGKGIKSFLIFKLIDELVAKIRKVNVNFSDEEKKALRCIAEVGKNITIAVNDAKNLVEQVKILCSTLNRVINSKANNNDEKLHLAISVFEKSMDHLLPKLENARDGLSKVTAELNAIVLEIANLKNWCLNKKEELENEKKSSVTKQRAAAYGGAATATVTASAIVATTCWWNPVGWVAGIIATGTAAGSAALTSFSIAANVTEGHKIPVLEKKYDDGIKDLEESLSTFQKMSNENKERSKVLTEKLDQLATITAVALQVKVNASVTVEVDLIDSMCILLRDDVKELEDMCDAYLGK